MTARSNFIPKLHDLLENSTNAGNPFLSWVDSDSGEGTAFQISSHDLSAREALSPAWEFRSLSSFIRQLSYYGFKRLSDRRRSVARRTPTPPKTIVFSHPIDGCFVQGGLSNLHLIVRKCRARKGDMSSGIRRRKPSSASQSAKSSREHTPPSPVGSEQDELASPVRVVVKQEVGAGGERRSTRGNYPLPKRQLSLAELPQVIEPELRRRGSTGGNPIYSPYPKSHPIPLQSSPRTMQPQSHSTLPPLSANTPAVPTPRYRTTLQPSAIDYHQYDPQPIQWHSPYPKYQNPQFLNSPYSMEPTSLYGSMYNPAQMVDPQMEQQNRFIPYNQDGNNFTNCFDPPSPCDTNDSTMSTRTEEFDDRHAARPAQAQTQQFDEIAHRQYLQQFHHSSPPHLYAPRPMYDYWPQMALA